MSKRIFAAACMAGAVFMVGAATVTAAEINLKAGYFISNQKSLTRQAFDQFVAKVNADGKGLVRIGKVIGKESIPSRQLGNAVKSGLLDLAGTPPAYMANLVKLATGFTPTTKTAKEMRANGAWDIFKGLFAKSANMHLLSMYGGDIVFHIYSNKRITKLSDFKGMKLRTSNTYKAFFDALGARTLQMPRSAIFTAMERGTVDAFANLDSEVISQGWHEIAKYRLVPGFYHPIIIVGVNMNRWKAMTGAQQAVLTTAGLYLENELSADLGRKDRAIGHELVTTKGMTLTTLSKAESKIFIDLSHTSQWDVVEKRDPVIGKKLRALIGK